MNRSKIGRRALWAGWAFVVLLVLLTVTGLLSGCTSAPPDYEAQDRARARAEALAPLDTLLAAVWRVVPLAGVVGVLALGARFTLAAIVRFERERTPNPGGSTTRTGRTARGDRTRGPRSGSRGTGGPRNQAERTTRVALLTPNGHTNRGEWYTGGTR